MGARIEICGGIAAGKTTFANLLERIGFRATYENFRAVPFWADFYRSPKEFAFQTEVSFLLQHYQQISTAPIDKGWTICDYSMIQDLSYAEINLDGKAKEAFLGVYGYVRDSVSPPKIIIHLKCGEEEQLARIRRRGRLEEAEVNVHYLGALNSTIARFIPPEEPGRKVLEIDSAECDFAHNVGDKTAVEDLIQETVRSLNLA